MPLASGTRLGPYEIAAQIGAGGMGEVYRARDTRLDRDVAVKVLPEHVAGDADRLRRFEQEARAAAALNHPNIIAVYDVGAYDGAPFVVTELLDGRTLRELLRLGPLPAGRVLDLALQIANGLAAAHSRGIVHRDLKPENVFVTSDGHVKILDFGLAKLVEPPGTTAGEMLQTRAAATMPGVVLGTGAYMSPEQARGQDVDHRADIFSFGAVLYEMLSGERAFGGGTPADAISAVLTKEPPELTPARRELALDRIARHCLEKAPDRRFQSARDLVFALQQIGASGASSGIDARRPQGVRERAYWAAAVAVLVLVGAGLAVALFGAKRRAPHPEVTFVVAGPGTVSYAVGTRIAELFNAAPSGIRTELVTDNAVSAIRRLATHEADVAISFNLVAFHAANTDKLLGTRSPDLTAITVAWRASAHVVVRADSDVRTILDLRGKRVSLGAERTGDVFCSQVLLAHFGIGDSDISVRSADLDAALGDIIGGRLDAAIAWRGVPLAELSQAFAIGALRLVSIDEDSLRSLKLKHPFLLPSEIPARTYPHQDVSAWTISARMLLLASRTLAPDVVDRMMTIIAGHRPDLIARHPAAAEIIVSRLPAIEDGLSVELHPGAQQYFKRLQR